MNVIFFTHPTNHHQTGRASIEESNRRAAKSKNEDGKPIRLQSKILAISEDPFNPGAVYVAESAGSVRKVALETGETLALYRGPTAPLTSVAFSPDGKLLFAGCWDKTVWSWDVQSRQQRQKYEGHADFVKTVTSVRVNGRDVLVSGGADSKLIVFDIKSGEKLHVFKDHLRGIQDIRIDPVSIQEGSSKVEIFSAGSDREIRQFSIALDTAKAGNALIAHDTSVYKLFFDEDGDLWTASADKFAKCLTRDSGWKPNLALEHPDFVRDVVVYDQGGWVVTACRDEEIRVWNKATGQLFHTYSGHFEEVTGLALIGSTVVSVSIDATIRQWSVRPADVQEAKEEMQNKKPQEEQPKQESMLTEEEERELAELMGEDDSTIARSLTTSSMADKSREEPGAAEARPKLVNRLHESRSPYVRGHMHNPVAWQLWDSQSIALAKKYNQLIFVSIGYSACHWCHVMEKESFMSSEVANILNESFIPIKVDREERPDIDDVYMNYVQATTGSGGWPLNVFLTPDLEPVFGGTYWPGPQSSSPTQFGPDGPIGFVDILEKLRDVWQTQQARCLDSAKEITRQLREFAEEGTHAQPEGKGAEDLEVELLEEAFQHFASRYDPVHGGFGRAPKFPTAANLSFLLRLGMYPSTVSDIVGQDECARATTMAVTTLLKIARGGIRDHIGNGFARYSVTPEWLLPHFEKMLYDQAQLLEAYVDAFRVTHEPELLGAVYDIVSYLTSSRIQAPSGGFHSSEDADSLPTPNDTEKREGAFYVWTMKEFKQVLGTRDAGVCARHWGVLSDGNIAPENDPHDELIDQNVLSIQVTPSKLAKEFGLSDEEVIKTIKSGKQKLREYREKTRGLPDLDDKIIVAWNGLAIGALAKASVLLDEIDQAKAQQCRDSAQRAVGFIQQNLFEPSTGRLWRIYRDGSRGDTPGFADDYAYLTSGLIALYEATFDDSHLQFAEQLQKHLNENFLAPGPEPNTAAGYYTTSSTPIQGVPGPLLRLKGGTDSATPSVNGVIARNLMRLSALLEDDKYKTLARQTCNTFSVEMLQHPFLFVNLLDAIVGLEMGIRNITGVVAGQAASGKDAVIRRTRAEAGLAASTSTATMAVVDARGESWIKGRNVLYRDLKAGTPPKDFLLVCEAGSCKTMDL
ncbi:putative protein YyaL [Talaromyces islandicus]|uniref:Spermatogenesis-associated protein 20-like TRX domain-containing protein n=1 Tax=Talaromyces islandicus TaxID=28573 RepID=A0A0U1LJ83_TALIS|nr:putative protein YyaL [Talaromyces islandicus]